MRVKAIYIKHQTIMSTETWLNDTGEEGGQENQYCFPCSGSEPEDESQKEIDREDGMSMDEEKVRIYRHECLNEVKASFNSLEGVKYVSIWLN